MLAIRYAASAVSLPWRSAAVRTGPVQRLVHTCTPAWASPRAAAQRSRDKLDAQPRLTQSPKPVKGDPSFRELWRKFQLKVHPDLFGRIPELQAANSASLQKLQGILNECKSGPKTTDDYLKPRVESLEFYLRTDKDNAFLKVPLTIRIPGSNCRHVLAESFAVLFKQAGLPPRFHWGPEYWQSTYVAAERRDGEDGEDA